jgi:hypothetical protein
VVRPLVILLVVLAGILAGAGVILTLDPNQVDRLGTVPTADLVAVATSTTASTAPLAHTEESDLVSENPGSLPSSTATSVDPTILAAVSTTASTATVIASTTTTTLPFDAESEHCPDQGRAAVVDRDAQRTWLCEDGEVLRVFPVTTQRSQPDPGDYTVDAKDLNASSTIGGQFTTMTHFVVFTRGKYQGARIGFHSVPKDSTGAWIQPLDSVGTAEYHGASSGCLRVLPEDAEALWDFLDNGGLVRVIT